MEIIEGHYIYKLINNFHIRLFLLSSRVKADLMPIYNNQRVILYMDIDI